MSTTTVKIHHGELVDMIKAALTVRGQFVVDELHFSYVHGRCQLDGDRVNINDSGSYLTVECEIVQPDVKRHTERLRHISDEITALAEVCR